MTIFKEGEISYGSLKISMQESNIVISTNVKNVILEAEPKISFVQEKNNSIDYYISSNQIQDISPNSQVFQAPVHDDVHKVSRTNQANPEEKFNLWGYMFSTRIRLTDKEKEQILKSGSQSNTNIMNPNYLYMPVMLDSSREHLVEDLNEKRGIKLPPILFVLAVILTITLYLFGAPIWTYLIVWALYLVLRIYTSNLMNKLRTSIVIYGLDLNNQLSYQELMTTLKTMSECKNIWTVLNWDRHDTTPDKKYEDTRRAPVSMLNAPPPFFITNVYNYKVEYENTSIYFMPDQILIYGPNQVKAISYKEMTACTRTIHYIEKGRLSADSTKVGTTYKYVTKNGNRDMRYKENPMYAICVYDEIELKDTNGFALALQFSKSGVATNFPNVMKKMSWVNPQN